MDILAYCAVISALLLLASIVDLLKSCLKAVSYTHLQGTAADGEAG